MVVQTNQGAKQAAVRAITGTTYDYNGDWMALFDLYGIPRYDFNGRFLRWLQITTGSNKTDINDLKQLYARLLGFNSWGDINTLVPTLPNLGVWLKSSDTSTLTVEYQNIASTVTGTVGGSTLVCSGDETNSTRAGRSIRVAGTDVYTIASAVTSLGVTTVTIVGTLSASYTTQAAAILRVSQWNDKSGNGNHALQGTINSQPALLSSGINSKPSLNFSANNMSIANNAGLVPGNAGITVFVVTRNNLDTGTEFNIIRKWFGAGTRAFLLDFLNNGAPDNIPFGITSDGTNGTFVNYNQPALGTSLLLELKGRASTSTNSQFYVNKVSAGTATELVFASTSSILIGGTVTCNIDIAEILIYMRELSDSESAVVTRYLGDSWALPVSAPLKYNPTVWLDATDATTITSIGGAVSQWSDKSGYGYNAAQGTALSQPVTGSSTINGRNAINFDSNTFMVSTLSTAITSSSLTCFVVVKRTGVIMDASPIEGINTGQVYDYNNAESAVLFGEGAGAVIQPYRNNATLSTAVHPGNAVSYIASNVFNGTTETTYLNGVASSPVDSTGSFNINRLLLAARYFSSAPVTAGLGYNGCVGEVLVYNYALTTAQRQDVEAYLSSKWGISL